MWSDIPQYKNVYAFFFNLHSSYSFMSKVWDFMATVCSPGKKTPMQENVSPLVVRFVGFSK